MTASYELRATSKNSSPPSDAFDKKKEVYYNFFYGLKIGLSEFVVFYNLLQIFDKHGVSSKFW